jgi:hypothetical protein
MIPACRSRTRVVIVIAHALGRRSGSSIDSIALRRSLRWHRHSRLHGVGVAILRISTSRVRLISSSVAANQLIQVPLWRLTDRTAIGGACSWWSGVSASIWSPLLLRCGGGGAWCGSTAAVNSARNAGIRGPIG